MAFRSLRARLLVVQSALVVGLTAATLAYVSARANAIVGDRIAADLSRSAQTIRTAEVARYQSLQQVASLVASFPRLNAVFMTNDAATIRDHLSEYRQSSARPELLVAVNVAGEVIARTDSFAPLQIPGFLDRWIEPTRNGQSVFAEIDVDGVAHHATMEAAQAGGTFFGFILVAAPLDAAWAASLREASGQEIVLLGPRGVAGSTISAQRVPWRSPSDLPATPATWDANLGGERFQALAVPQAPASLVRVVSLQSRDVALAPYQRIQAGLLLLGLVTAGLGIAGSAFFARTLTKPIDQLVNATRHVAEGRYDVPVQLAREDELGTLARSFNEMTTGLRERADMQKFVSQSTIEMIHRQVAPAPLAGERRVVTLLFSDVRGFTAFADTHAPEAAVAALNHYLRLQAELVARFSGDVDKFIGDAVFAQFAGPDMAFNAIRCAVEIQRAVAGAPATDPTLPALSVGIGIATGPVIVGNIGSEARLDYTAIGPAVNLSSRLCSAAEPGQILIGDETFSRVRDLIAAEPIPPLAVKGFAAPVVAYRMAIKTA